MSIWSLTYQQSVFKLNAVTTTNVSQSFAHKMAARIGWHRYGTKLRHCHPVYYPENILLPIRHRLLNIHSLSWKREYISKSVSQSSQPDGNADVAFMLKTMTSAGYGGWERVACGRTASQAELVRQARELIGSNQLPQPHSLKLWRPANPSVMCTSWRCCCSIPETQYLNEWCLGLQRKSRYHRHHEYCDFGCVSWFLAILVVFFHSHDCWQIRYKIVSKSAFMWCQHGYPVNGSIRC